MTLLDTKDMRLINLSYCC